MPTKKLTNLFVERVKPPPRGRVEYFDAVFGGLALRVTDRGHKSWTLFYRIGGRLRRFTIGNCPPIKPAQARREADDALERVRQGIDPAVEKKARRLSPSPESDTFGILLQDYLERYASKNTAPAMFKETKRMIERDVLPIWRDRPISGITRRDVIDLIDGIVARGVEVQANRTLARLRALFNWAVEKDRLTLSPITGMRPPTKEYARDRALTDDELRWFWAACETVKWPFGPLAKLLLLTAQRRDEVAGMEWPELDLVKKTWTIPHAKAKNNRTHEVQLSATAIEILRSVPRVGNGLVFTTTGDTPISGFSRAKRRLDAAMVKVRRQSLGLSEKDTDLRKCLGIADGKPRPVEIPDWIFHDLRRTAATGMARLNVPPHVVDKVLNHVSGQIRGVAAVYNRFEYLDERRAALDAWGRYVARLVIDASSNVVAIRRTVP
jgi:integrase